MSEFLKSLADKFLDFFNIGRAISIIIPGSLVAIVLLMLVSLAIFPPAARTTSSADEKTAPRDKKVLANVSSGKVKQEKKFGNCSTHQAGAKGAPPAKKPESPSSGAQAGLDKSKPPNKLGEQITGDFLRVTKHYWVVLLVALVVGILLYEVGSVIIAAWTEKTGPKLYSFMKKAPGDKTLEFDEGTKEAEVGFIYFAPFLKADFTGKENYYSFLITEYYRFLEFSAVMPLAVLTASILAIVYYIVACHVIGTCCHVPAIILAFIVVLLAVILFYLIVFSKVLGGYRKKTKELIRGVVDATNKEIK